MGFNKYAGFWSFPIFFKYFITQEIIFPHFPLQAFIKIIWKNQVLNFFLCVLEIKDHFLQARLQGTPSKCQGHRRYLITISIQKSFNQSTQFIILFVRYTRFQSPLICFEHTHPIMWHHNRIQKQLQYLFFQLQKFCQFSILGTLNRSIHFHLKR